MYGAWADGWWFYYGVGITGSVPRLAFRFDTAGGTVYATLKITSSINFDVVRTLVLESDSIFVNWDEDKKVSAITGYKNF
jgi:hypothetical protein